MDYHINFPNLGIYLEHVGKSISIGGFSIAFYGMVIACGMLCGIALACRMAKWDTRYQQNPDDYMDMAVFTIIFSVICARIYYVVFRWDLYKDNLIRVFYIREGGLAIYGGVIGAFVSVFIWSCYKKKPFGLLVDTAIAGLAIGQVIGRWGNFFNREAFGGYTDNLLAMQLPVSAVRQSEITAEQWEHVLTIDGVQYIQVHPCFLYESLWNLCVVCLLIWFFRKKRKFDGECGLLYLAAYGAGRFWIEGLRTDQLLIPGTDYPVSRALAAVMFLVSTIWILIGHSRAVRKEKEAAGQQKIE